VVVQWDSVLCAFCWIGIAYFFFSVIWYILFIPAARTCYSRIKVFRMITERNAIGNLRKIKFVALKSYSLQLVLAFDVFYCHFCLLISVDFYFLCLPVQVETYRQQQ